MVQNPADVVAIEAAAVAIQTATDRLEGEATVNGTTTANWQAAEADLVSIGVAATKRKLHIVIVDMNALTAAATLTIRFYLDVNGVERQIYEEAFVVGTDPDGVPVVDGTLAIHDILRVTCQSDTVGDNGRAIAYTYILEDME